MLASTSTSSPSSAAASALAARPAAACWGAGDAARYITGVAVRRMGRGGVVEAA